MDHWGPTQVACNCGKEVFSVRREEKGPMILKCFECGRDQLWTTPDDFSGYIRCHKCDGLTFYVYSPSEETDELCFQLICTEDGTISFLNRGSPE